MSRAGRLPDFLLIGAMKSGTTTLYARLSEHPDLFLSTPKEPQFFSRDAVYERGLDWYRSLFAAAAPEQVCGEASACYSRWPHFGDVAGRIARDLPGVKLVYLMRHPVERAYSHYTHAMEERMLRGTGPTIPFEQALEEIPEILDASRYRLQIEQYLRHFPRERLLALTLDELRADPIAALGRVHAFLGVAEAPPISEAKRAENRMGDRMARVRTRGALEGLRNVPGLARMIDAVPKRFRTRLRAAAMRPEVTRLLNRRALRQHRQSVSPLTPDTRARLVELLSGPTRELEDFLGRPLPGWFA